VIVTDRKGRVERINPAAASLTGISPSEAIGQPLHLAMRISREHNALAIQNLLDQLQEREIVHHIAYRIHNRRERAILLAELSGSALENGDGEFDGTVRSGDVRLSSLRFSESHAPKIRRPKFAECSIVLATAFAAVSRALRVQFPGPAFRTSS
jgi:PAS domain S-box-containing protein